MPVELGQVVDGTVTGITDFGAFIQLPDGKTGLCHISEIADEYVKSVKDYLTEKQTVKVKVIEINGKGKVSLSIRKANEDSVKKTEDNNNNKGYEKSFSKGQDKGYDKSKERNFDKGYDKPKERNFDRGYDKSRERSFDRSNDFSRQSKSGAGFEDMLSKYLKDSDEKLKDFKKSINKRRSNGFNRKES